MRKSKPVEDSYDAINKVLEASKRKREKTRTKKPTTIGIVVPKGCIVKELKPVIQQYVNELLADDFDWDFSYLLRMIKYKLSRMRKALKGGYSADADKVCAQILEVEKALGRIDDDDYSVKRIDVIHKKYDVKFGTKEENGKCLFATLPRKKNGTFDEKAYNAEIKRAFKDAADEMRKDLSIAFDGMKKNVLSWWD